MNDFSAIYYFLTLLLEEFRKEIHIPIDQLCSTSGVSSRTYAKLKKKRVVKPECYARLVIGFCRVATPEEFMRFWGKVGVLVYEEYG